MQGLTKKGLTPMWHSTVGSNLCDNRERAVVKAREVGAKWLFYVDSDVVIPPYTLERLMSRDRDIVSGMYHGKQYPFPPIASRAEWLDDRQYEAQRTYRALGEWPLDGIVDDLDGVGGGCLLIKVKVFEKLVEPFFAFSPTGMDQDYARVMQAVRLAVIQLEGETKKQTPSREILQKVVVDLKTKQDECLAESENRGCLGEDYYFCRKAKQAGFNISLDTTVKCLHIGQHLYGMNDCVGAIYREAEMRRQAEEGARDDGNGPDRKS